MSNSPEQKPSADETARRVAWFEWYTDKLNAQPPDLPPRCPCCGYRTLVERGDFDICPVCFWEDDGQDDYDADIVRGGPNGSLSLTVARANYCRCGACDDRHINSVRPPTDEELPQQPLG
ncbi:MAG: hypothetical protein DWQ37_05330 [Planctomycetota bacterium]|nr:MAG: hypothetical protein DWQ37_05330 [Planctomycetota bacterium]